MNRAAGILSALAVTACAPQTAPAPKVVRAAPARPAGGALVRPEDDLRERIRVAGDGDVLWLAPGRHRGPLRIATRITLWGPADAVVTSDGAGTTVQVDAAGARLLGFTIDGSGGRFDLLDAALCVRADDVLVEGLGVRRALFGILVEKCKRVVLRGNEVIGTGQPALGLRGDTIRLWETDGCVLEANSVHDGRDVVVWYSDRAQLRRNEVRAGRYGTHFMYSRGSVVEHNRYDANVVGVFLMYTHDVALRGNTITRSAGAAGIGIGLKESGALALEDNTLIGNTVGLFVDTSPLDPAEHNRIERNAVRFSQTAVVFHGGTARNRFADNSFRDNGLAVRVDGGGDAMAARWEGNCWDEYQGYDLDGDGFGDLPHELASSSGQILGRAPDVAFFSGTPSLFLVDVAARVLPIFAAKRILRDARPRMRAVELADAR
jgi:nitrous oxidase accessory protein